MKIAVDYDDTYTADRLFWRNFIYLCAVAGHEVKIVTYRDERHDRDPDLCDLEATVGVIYTRGVAKAFYCTHFANWLPDVWIDDKPESILHNSAATPEWLKEWRASRGAPAPLDHDPMGR